MLQFDKNGFVIPQENTFVYRLYLERLAVTLMQLDISVSDLAAGAELSTATIYKIINRYSKGMHVTTLAKLANSLKLSPEFLLGTRPPKTKEEKLIDEEALAAVNSGSNNWSEKTSLSRTHAVDKQRSKNVYVN